MSVRRSRFVEEHRGVLIFELWIEYYDVEGNPKVMERGFQPDEQFGGSWVTTIDRCREQIDRILAQREQARDGSRSGRRLGGAASA